MTGWFVGQIGSEPMDRVELYRSFRWSDHGYVWPALLGVAILVLVWVGWKTGRYFVRKMREREAGAELFARLVRAHHLDAEEEKALRAASSRLGMDDPAGLFVRRSVLEEEAERRKDETLERLVGKLFN